MRFSAAAQSLVDRTHCHNVGDLFRRSADHDPTKTAVVDADRRLSHQDLDAAVNRLADHLAERGLRKGGRIALLSHNCWQFGALSFAMARLSAVLVPINFMLNAMRSPTSSGMQTSTA